MNRPRLPTFLLIFSSVHFFVFFSLYNPFYIAGFDLVASVGTLQVMLFAVPQTFILLFISTAIYINDYKSKVYNILF